MKTLSTLALALVALAVFTVLGLWPVGQAEAKANCIPPYDTNWADCYYMDSCNRFWAWWCNLGKERVKSPPPPNTTPKAIVTKECGPFPKKPDQNYEQCVEKALNAFEAKFGASGAK